MMSLNGGFDVSHPSLELAERRIDVWYRTVSSADETWLESAMYVLSADERARATAFRTRSDRLAFLMGRVILRCLLARYANVTASELVIQAPAGVKPVVVAPDPAVSIEFNLSHTTGLLVWAFGLGRAIGVDAEHMPRMKVLDPPPADFFSISERRRIASARLEERELRLSQLWTLKEALAKARGTGLARDPAQSSFAVGADGAVECENAGSTDAASWDFCLLRPTPLHTAALCVQKAPRERLEIRVLSDLP
jgi:4'-phosphopantetheinyl transferase